MNAEDLHKALHEYLDDRISYYKSQAETAETQKDAGYYEGGWDACLDMRSQLRSPFFKFKEVPNGRK